MELIYRPRPGGFESWRRTLRGLDDADMLDWYDAIAGSIPQGGVVVEVGVYRGRSLLYLASRLGELGRDDVQLYGVDLWAGPGDPACIDPQYVGYETALEEIICHAYPGEIERLRLLRCSSIQAARALGPDAVSVVMIDGDHADEAVQADIDAWVRCLRVGGVLAGHDYHPRCPGVIAAVDRALPGAVEHHGTVWWTHVVR